MISKKDYDKIMDYCYSNNTIKFKESKLRLAITDGGWINVLEFQSFLEKLVELEATKK